MTPKQKMEAALSNANHARLMLRTAARLTDDPHGYRADYLQWSEQALLRAAEHVKGLRNM